VTALIGPTLKLRALIASHVALQLVDRCSFRPADNIERHRTVSSQIRKQLDTVVSPKSRLTKPVRKPKATWVEPSFVADVEIRDITSEGLLRQSSFKGLSKKER
jgi:hypothetical protein